MNRADAKAELDAISLKCLERSRKRVDGFRAFAIGLVRVNVEEWWKAEVATPRNEPGSLLSIAWWQRDAAAEVNRLLPEKG